MGKGSSDVKMGPNDGLAIVWAICTVAHKTVPMFCGFGQKCLVWSDDIIKGPETYVK